jgi:signal transduction histidine kinase/CheY-like chemotaxis protein
MPAFADRLLSNLNPRKSLKTRLIVNTTGIVLALSLLLSLLLGYVSSMRIQADRVQLLEELASQMADKLDQGMFERYKDIQILSALESINLSNSSLATKRKLLENLQNIYPDYAWIGLTDTQGDILAATGGLLEGKNVSQRPWFQLALTKPYVGDVHEAVLLAKLLPHDQNEPLRFVDVAAPIVDSQGRFQGVIGAHLSWQWAKDVERSLQQQVLLTGLCLSGLFTAISWFYARHISEPILTLSKVADRIRQGEQQVKMPIYQGKDEIATLSKSFVYMVSSLGDRTEALKAELNQRRQAEQSLRDSEGRYRALSETLEIKVHERTNKLSQRQKQLEIEITERQKAERIAEDANHAKSKFLANMSHELRTPLSAIIGFAQLMSRDLSLNPAQQENLTIINRSGRHLLELINDILDLSKIEAGKITLQENEVNLDCLLDDLEAMFSLQAKSKGLRFNFELADQIPPYIQADEKKLRQVLINLLSNAIKFTDRGNVTLKVKSQKSKVKSREQEIDNFYTPHSTAHILIFEVEDTGWGIAPEEAGRLFQAFSQTQAGYKSQAGTGLGLAISHHFVQLMGGELFVSSVLERGTLFKFAIPLKTTQNASESTVAITSKVVGLASNQPQYRILIVEDQPANRQLLVQLLQTVGFEVQSAANGQEAIALCQSWSPNLIWMDLQMPVMSGKEATRIIRTTNPDTVIIALTANIFEQRQFVLEFGGDDLVYKPFTEEEIFNKMAQYLRVEYLYQEVAETFTTIDSASELLTPEALAQMPDDWIKQLHTAAIKLDNKAIAKLIEQIPDDSELKPILTKLIDNVRFDIIVDVVQLLVKFDNYPKIDF